MAAIFAKDVFKCLHFEYIFIIMCFWGIFGGKVYIGSSHYLVWGSFHCWESELTFGNLTNFWKLANQKVS